MWFISAKVHLKYEYIKNQITLSNFFSNISGFVLSTTGEVKKM